MLAALGYLSLITALLFALLGTFLPLLSRGKAKAELPVHAGWPIFGQFLFVTSAALTLIYALVATDFSIKYVVFNTTSRTSLYYRVTGLWGSLEGSLLLWEWFLVLFSALLVWTHRDRLRELMPYVLAILSGVSAFFLLLMASASNPFERIFPIPTDGRGLNPLLEDTNMMSHPPLLYAGFVGLTIPYAFAMAALATGRLNDNWVASVRRWTITAWFFLTMGNLVGAWWSYHVLGWGGYWAWDPVENAAILPWLPATAFLHSVQIQERRGMLKVWNLSLIIMAFSLTIFATFLTRSGVLSSVHAFSSGAVGAYLLIFLGIVLFGSLALLAWRSPLLKTQPELDSLICRESAFVMNNVVFVAATFTIFLGTIFPILAEAVTGVKISVGAPYFNQITAPLFLLIVFLMGVGPLIVWRKASLDNLKRNFLWPASTALALGLVLFVAGVRDFYPLLALTLCIFVVATIDLDIYRAVRARRTLAGENILQAFVRVFQRNQRRYGGFVVHLGVVLIVMGIAVSMSYSVEKEAALKRGEELKVGRYSLLFNGLGVSERPTHVRVEGLFQVFNDRHYVGTLSPALKFFPQRREPISRATFRSSLNEDLYLVLSGFSELEKEFATVRLLVRPMVSWIWIGGAIIALGTLIVLLPMRDDSRSSEQ